MSDNGRGRRLILVLGTVFVIDSIVLGQGIWSLLISAFGIALLAVGAVRAMIRRAPLSGAYRFGRAGAYLLLAVGTVAAMRFHAATAQSRAAHVIAACRAYHAAHGSFPDRLEDVVPRFLPVVPRAKYALSWSSFSYWNSSGTPEKPDHVLMYVAFPPFGRRLYHLEEDRWSTLD